MAGTFTKFGKFGGILPIDRADASSGNIPMTLGEFAAASYAVEQALKFGNYDPLLDRLRAPGVLLGLERNLAADIIEGKLKRPSHRIKQPGAQSKKWLIAFYVANHMRQGLVEKAAVQHVVKERGISKSSVRDAIAAAPPEMFASLKRRRRSQRASSKEA